MKKMTLAFVLPCYNEEAALPKTADALKQKLAALKADDRFKSIAFYKVYFVDDGSSDNTWHIIQNLAAEDPTFCGVKLAANRGHQNALLAGLMTAKEKADADNHCTRIFYLFGEHRNAHLFFNSSLYRQNDRRLVVACRFDLGYRRLDSNVDRCTRRIHRKNLFGNEASSALYY